MSRTKNMDRFTEETPKTRHIGEVESTFDDEQLTPMLEQLDELQPLPVVIGTWNRIFGRNEDTTAEYSKFTLTNFAMWADSENQPWIARQLKRHAACAAKQI